MEHDTAFLAKMETIDYSLLLGRYPIEMFHDKPDPSKHRDPLVLPKKDDFVRGVRSADGKWVYKMCILDFFWNVQQLRPKIIKAAGAALPEQTTTAEPERYREEFLKYGFCSFLIKTSANFGGLGCWMSISRSLKSRIHLTKIQNSGLASDSDRWGIWEQILHYSFLLCLFNIARFLVLVKRG